VPLSQASCTRSTRINGVRHLRCTYMSGRPGGGGGPHILKPDPDLGMPSYGTKTINCQLKNANSFIKGKTFDSLSPLLSNVASDPVFFVRPPTQTYPVFGSNLSKLIESARFKGYSFFSRDLSGNSVCGIINRINFYNLDVRAKGGTLFSQINAHCEFSFFWGGKLLKLHWQLVSATLTPDARTPFEFTKTISTSFTTDPSFRIEVWRAPRVPVGRLALTQLVLRGPRGLKAQDAF
jgi:hypothetical protein